MKVDQAETLRKIVFVTSEVAPWSKTGGLGDVCGALPIALADRGHRVMVVSPRYVNKKTAARYDKAEDLDISASVSPCFVQLVVQIIIINWIAILTLIAEACVMLRIDLVLRRRPRSGLFP